VPLLDQMHAENYDLSLSYFSYSNSVGTSTCWMSVVTSKPFINVVSSISQSDILYLQQTTY